MTSRRFRTVAIAAFVVISTGPSAMALTIEDVKIDPAALSPKCTAIDGEHAISIQARTHYANVEKNPPILFKPPTRKAYQSFSCDDAKSTVYYFEYASKADLEKARGFTEGLIWSEGGRCKEHPEIIVREENVLVIISSKNPESFTKFVGKKR